MSNVTYIVSPKAYSHFKEKARKLKRQQKIKLHQAQELVARSSKFDNWNQIAQAHKRSEPFFNAYHKGVVIGLEREDVDIDPMNDACSQHFLRDDYYILYHEGKDDIYSHLSELKSDDDGTPLTLTEADKQDILNEIEIEYVFYAYTNAVNGKDKHQIITTLVKQLKGSIPEYLWIQGEYINTDALLDDPEIMFLRSSTYRTYCDMKEGDDVIFHAYEVPFFESELAALKRLEREELVKITGLQANSHASFMKLSANSKVFKSLSQALQAAKTIDSERTIVGVAYDNNDRYSPYQFFELVYSDEDGEDWYSVHYNGSHFWSDGRSGEEDSYGQESIDELIEEVSELFPQIKQINFREVGDMVFELYPEELLYRIFPDLPKPDKYWTDNQPVYEQMCIERINQANKR